MTIKQLKWLAEHQGYELISSCGGPYLFSGVLYADGTFDDSPEAPPAHNCLYVGEKSGVEQK